MMFPTDPNGTWAAVVYRQDGSIDEWWGWYVHRHWAEQVLALRKRELQAEDSWDVRKLKYFVEQRTPSKPCISSGFETTVWGAHASVNEGLEPKLMTTHRFRIVEWTSEFADGSSEVMYELLKQTEDGWEPLATSDTLAAARKAMLFHAPNTGCWSS